VSGRSDGLPVVAIVGRPNVGKSTLFNRLVGDARAAIVEDRARTTRDRLYGDAEWNGRRFVIVDTGGLEVAPGDAIEEQVQVQARLAIAEADVIVFMVDASIGRTPADDEAADLLRRSQKPVILVGQQGRQREARAGGRGVPRVRLGGHDRDLGQSRPLGRGPPRRSSSGRCRPSPSASSRARRRRTKPRSGPDEMAAGRLEPVIAGEDEDDEDDDIDPDETPDAEAARWDAVMAAESDDPPAIAFVGRPNVGKSSLLNALLGEDRMIVSDIPGTTRDAIDTRIPWGRSEVVLIDTAGIRRRGKVASGPAAERYSTLRALKAITRADVAVLVLDAVDGLTAQDAHVAGYVVDEGKGLVIAINKWDLVEKDHKTFDDFVGKLRRDAPFLDFAPVVSISAVTGQRVDRVLELAVEVWGERRKRITTGELNRLLSDAVERQPPPMVRGRRTKLRYGTQAGINPPTFVFFATDPSSLHFSYRRYLENRLRDALEFTGTPIRLFFREQVREKRPRKRRAPGRKG
jgi:GTPase